jgi:peptide deformylase
MILDIVKYGDTNGFKLRAKNIDVSRENLSLNSIIDNMFETLKSTSGVGLAAPQVSINLNLFIIKTSNFQEVFINPEIQIDGLSVQNKEGCLSFPNLSFPVNRREKVKVKFYDRNWTLRYAEYKDDIAIIVQHEFDHLKGKLIID